MFFFFADCGDVYELNHGHVNFTGRITTYGETIPVTCNVGYNLAGDTGITCLDTSFWSTTTRCEIVGQYKYRKNSKHWDTLNYYRDCPTNGIVGF